MVDASVLAMLPARGVCFACRASGYGVTLTVPRSVRKFSSLRPTGAPSLRLFKTYPATSFRHSKVPRHQLSPAAPALFQARHNSSLPPSIPNFAPETSQLLPETSTVLSDPTLRVSGSGDTWYYGFLNDELGGFGWGPTSCVQWLFEHIHIWTASPLIGLTIIATAATIRVLTIYPVGLASHTGAQLAKLTPEMKPIQDKYTKAQREGDRMAMSKYMQLMMQMRREKGVKLRRMAYPFGQAIIGFGTWRLLRNMSDLPVPGMTDGGFLWFSNLAVPDPYCLLPVITSVSQYMSIKLGGETGAQDVAASKFRNMLMYGLPCLSFVFTSFAPAGVTLSFAIASFASLGTNTLMRNARFRSRFNMAPIVKREAPGGPTVLDTTGKVIDNSARKPDPTLSSKVTRFVKDTRQHGVIGNLSMRYRRWKDELSTSVQGQGGGMLERMFPTAETKAERQKKEALDRREELAGPRYTRQEEARIKQIMESRKMLPRKKQKGRA